MFKINLNVNDGDEILVNNLKHKVIKKGDGIYLKNIEEYRYRIVQYTDIYKEILFQTNDLEKAKEYSRDWWKRNSMGVAFSFGELDCKLWDVKEGVEISHND